MYNIHTVAIAGMMQNFHEEVENSFKHASHRPYFGSLRTARTSQQIDGR
jgi:hypothetical protein